jgi:hypothetical protein
MRDLDQAEWRRGFGWDTGEDGGEEICPCLK